ncbi:MAG: hypothetical protein ACFFAN_20070, partial [Promethearchaeota archaeon]
DLLSEALENSRKWALKRKEMKTSLKELKKEYAILFKTKSKALKKKLKIISALKKNKLKQSYNQTSEKKIQINEDFLKKEASAKKGIENIFNPKIEEKKAEIMDLEANLSKVTSKTEEWSSEKEKLGDLIKKLRYKQQVLIKEKSEILNKELIEIFKKKKNKTKVIESIIEKKEAEIIKIKERATKEGIVKNEVENKYNPQINSAETDLNLEKRNLDEAIRKVNEWTTKKKELNDVVESLKKEYKKLIEKKNRDIVSENIDSEINMKNKRHVLILGKENILKFNITIENISSYIFQNILFIKEISKFFYDIKTPAEVNFENGKLEWQISQLKPGEKRELTFRLKVKPLKKENIGTGKIDLYGKIISSTHNFLSGIEIEDFLLYSNALHTILVKKDKDNNNRSECMLIFRNNSKFNMNLKSILVLDENRNNKILDLSLKKLISPKETYISEIWEIYNEISPKFFRKVNYSVVYKINNYGNIQMIIDQSFFKFIDIQFEKRFSESFLIQSARLMMEESRIENILRVKNTSTTLIDGIIIKEIIPKDFMLPTGKSNIKIIHSSGKVYYDNFEVKITPPNKDPSIQHILELFINLNENMCRELLGENEFLEIKYPIYINSPNYLKQYDFPIEITSCFSKYQDIKSLETKDFYYNKHTLPKRQQSLLRIGRFRQNLEFYKSIRPGQSLEEFSIRIIINNISAIEAKNINIMDNFPTSFEFISSNFKHKITNANNEDEFEIYFNIEKILPNQEKEIKYIIRNISGEYIDYSDLERYVFD